MYKIQLFMDSKCCPHRLCKLHTVQGLASLDRAGGATSLIAEAFGLLIRGTNEGLLYEAK